MLVILIKCRERVFMINICPCATNGYNRLNIFSSPHRPNIEISDFLTELKNFVYAYARF